MTREEDRQDLSIRGRSVTNIHAEMIARDRIVEHQFNKTIKSFASGYSQSFYWRILKTTILFSGLKNPYKKICEIRKLENIHEKNFVERKNEGRKPDKNARRLEFLLD
jgi:hypothetical protein